MLPMALIDASKLIHLTRFIFRKNCPYFKMKRADFESFLQSQHLQDEWWVSVGNEVLDATMSLDAVAELEYEFPGRAIALMHPDAVGNAASEWIVFDFEGMENLQAAMGQPELAESPSDTATSGTLDLGQKVEVLAEQIADMSGQLTQLSELVTRMDECLHSFTHLHQLKDELQSRQQFIEQSEETLLKKSIRYEQQVAELEQRMADSSQQATKIA
jgi:hypothetical protein